MKNKHKQIFIDEERYFRTTDLQLATFLYANKFSIAGLHPSSNSKKEKEFVFPLDNSPALLELVDVYKFGDYKFGDKSDERLLVEVHRYEAARRRLLDLINSPDSPFLLSE